MDRVRNIGRWVLLLPTSVAAAWAAYLLVKLVNGITAGPYLDPNSAFSKFWIEVIAAMAQGATFVHVGFRIAPAYKLFAASTLLALLLVLTGVNLALLARTESYVPLIASVVSVVGGSAVIVDSVHKHRSHVESQPE